MSGAALPPGVLAHWGLRTSNPLGGRLNQHWAVQVQGERAALRRWHGDEAQVRYEAALVQQVSGLGWAVPTLLAEPLLAQGAWWSLHAWVPGEAPAREAARQRGRWLAEVHAAFAALPPLPPRPGWRPAHAALLDAETDALLDRCEAARPAEVRLYRWHLHRARVALEGLNLQDRPSHLLHGDFTAWNLRAQGGRLTGLLDFELARPDDPVAEFALAWRGVHDEVVAGYDELHPLGDEARALLTPLWWAHLLEGAALHLRAGTQDDGWTARKLQVRSPLMGPLAAPYPG
ncbi:phosphotransferase enzyme family protein [Deinococcus aquaedulcis]|uniref:phosphotransferase enzyme family protein n=1 Tax=Deinococcus aquaedulcis TaxID=2840455 RepID=UPI001C837F2E|nr:aminoglycoside phosphotransferase family protein [Deinococcus aquaedulcis]